jgi:adenylyltransferase/sulfurtransferase
VSEPFKRIDVHELKKRLDDGWKPFVLDVRSQAEADEVSLPFVDRLEPHTSVVGIAGDLPKDRPIVIHCRSGGRSAMACNALASVGFTDLYNVEGGITAWVQQIDPSLAG